MIPQHLRQRLERERRKALRHDIERLRGQKTIHVFCGRKLVAVLPASDYPSL